MNENEAVARRDPEQVMAAEMLAGQADKHHQNQEAVKDALAHGNASPEQLMSADVLADKARRQAEDQQAVKDLLGKSDAPRLQTDSARETLQQLKSSSPGGGKPDAS